MPSARVTRRFITAVPLALALALACPVAAADVSAGLAMTGQLDVTLSNRGRPLELNRLNPGNTVFDAWRVRLDATAHPAPGVAVHAQMLVDDAAGPRAVGAYAVLTPSPSRDLHLMAGKIPWWIGTYAPRTYSERKPLIGTPLIYQYHSTLRPDAIPPDAAALLDARGSGQFGTAYAPGGSTFHGMPFVYDACWDFGAMLTGSARPVEFAAGFVNGTPGSPAPAQDTNDGRTTLGRIGLQLGPLARVGASAAYGPYLPDALAPELPAGRSTADYAQRVLMADAELSLGRLELRAEAMRNRWQTPGAGDLDTDGGYVELRLGLLGGAWLAGRYDGLRFGDVIGPDGRAQPWDFDVDRIEAGAGYRLARASMLKAVLQRTTELAAGARRPADLYALQYTVGF